MSIVSAPIVVDPAELKRLDGYRGRFWLKHDEIAQQKRQVEAEREGIRLDRQRIDQALREHQRVGEDLAARAIEQRRALDEREGALRKKSTALDLKLRKSMAGE